MKHEPDPSFDPTLAIAERQLAMLAELAEMAMAASRAFTASAIAASKAEQMILGEEWFTPEVGRARACGAKDAAESLQKVSRAVRLTLKLEMTVAEIARDINAGKITYINGVAAGNDAGEDAGAPAEGPGSLGRSAGVLAGSYSTSDTPDRERLDRDTEHLDDIERPDVLRRAAFRITVDDITADLGAEVDWTSGSLKPASPGRAAPAANLPVAERAYRRGGKPEPDIPRPVRIS